LGEQLLQTEKNGARTTVLAPLCLQSAILFNKKYLTFATYDVILKKKLKI